MILRDVARLPLDTSWLIPIKYRTEQLLHKWIDAGNYGKVKGKGMLLKVQYIFKIFFFLSELVANLFTVMQKLYLFFKVQICLNFYSPSKVMKCIM